MGDMSVDISRIAHAIGSVLASGIKSIGKLGGRAIDAMPKLPSFKNIFSDNVNKKGGNNNSPSNLVGSPTGKPVSPPTTGTSVAGGTGTTPDKQAQEHTVNPGPAQYDSTIGTASKEAHKSLELVGKGLETGHPPEDKKTESEQPETPATGQGGYVYGTKEHPKREQLSTGQWVETWKHKGVPYMRHIDGKPSGDQPYEWGTKDNPKIEQWNGKWVATWKDESGGKMKILDDGQPKVAQHQQPIGSVGMHGPTATSHHSHSGLPEGPRDWNSLENATWNMASSMTFQTGLPQNFDDIQSPSHTAISVSVGNGEQRPVHANMINALDGKQYIATEAPIHQDPTTNSQKAEAFWLMAHQQSSVIVDLTNSHDKHNGVAASHNYPSQKGETKNFGSVSVTCTSVSNSQDVPGTKVYTYSVFDKTTGQSKNVTRLNYEKWPDFGTASEHDVLKLTDLMGRHAGGKPPIVHCRAGVGRTGSVIATAVLKNLVQENKVSEGNIHSASGAVVLNLRAQRGPVTVQRDAQFNSVMTATKMAIEARKATPRVQFNNLNAPITTRQPPQGATNFYHELAGRAPGTFTVRPSKEGHGAITIDIVRPDGETVSHRINEQNGKAHAQDQASAYPNQSELNRTIIGVLQATYPGLTNFSYHSGK